MKFSRQARDTQFTKSFLLRHNSLDIYAPLTVWRSLSATQMRDAWDANVLI